MFRLIYNFFDKLEDRVRGRLSRIPILYAFVGGFGIVLFWRGVWHMIDYVVSYYMHELPWWDGVLSFFLGAVILLLSGTFVSSEIGNEVIISGLRGQKKLIDKTKEEIESEIYSFESIQKELKKISHHRKRGQKRGGKHIVANSKKKIV